MAGGDRIASRMMPKSQKLVALVAGASRGIGKAVARRLAVEGWDLVLVSRTGKAPVKGFSLRADLTVPEESERIVAGALRRFGRLDALVHCVGDYAESSLRRQSPGQWEALFFSNVHSAFYTARAALAPMRKQGSGRIVFLGMAGVSSLRPRRTCAAYAAAKTALLSYARSLAVEEAENGITVNVVSPGVVPHEGAHPSTRSRSLWEKIPAGRAGKPEEIAAAVRFLLSEEAGYVTGADLPVSGGWML